MLCVSRFLSRRLHLSSAVRITSDTFQGEYRQTTVNVLSKEVADRVIFESFSNFGFKLSNRVRVIGPCAAFPCSVVQWNVKDAADIDEAALSAFVVLHPKLEILVLGLGNEGQRLHPNIEKFIHSKGIALETLPTSEALTTFNFLNVDGRCVAGGFIPPTDMSREFADRDAIAYESSLREMLASDEGKDDMMFPVPVYKMGQFAVERARQMLGSSNSNAESGKNKDKKKKEPDQHSLG